MKKVNWPLAILLVWLFLFLIAAGLNAFEPRFCNAAMLDAISKQQDVLIFNCVEFWFNRYQSLIGNMITAGVAAITLWALLRQLNANNRQAAVTSAQALRLRITEIDDEKIALESEGLKLRPFMFEMHYDERYDRINPDDAFRMPALISDARSRIALWEKTCVFRLTRVPPERREAYYNDVLRAIQALEREFVKLEVAVEDYGPVSGDDLEVAQAANAVGKRLQVIKDNWVRLKVDIRQDEYATWRAIRRFEEAAVG
ncbi:hypothetical protein [Bosea sp. (in: a-proteobacteria)]|jgi:hypothetical protein|uniref:hypothetical protein n=1 Tax=Bosea sp. (in: a-proteobacteria) TaxID=1871050 RepID=UPI002DDD0D7E|nr:hypothetical protein [Bosea sp. (in: a-proteobacteria)]HEV2509980.1 hypothetical protein [Bosea sp. (in: a-proteobacteria)]